MKVTIAEVDFQCLKWALRLPPEVKLAGVRVPEDRGRCIYLYLESEEFQDYPEGAILPFVHLEFHEYAEIKD